MSEANKRRSQAFLPTSILCCWKQYRPFLADSGPRKEQKESERLLFMMYSTTISLFDNILEGIGRHPKSGKKKGGLKIHTCAI